VDFNAGIHYYSDQVYAGFSVIQLFDSDIQLMKGYHYPENENPYQNPDLFRSFYVYAGYFFEINRDMRIEPMFLVKYHDKRFRFDLNATFHLKDLLVAGAGYRWKEEYVAFAGVRLDNLAVQYQFEVPSSKSLYRSTSHMIQVIFNLGQPIE